MPWSVNRQYTSVSRFKAKGELMRGWVRGVAAWAVTWSILGASAYAADGKPKWNQYLDKRYYTVGSVRVIPQGEFETLTPDLGQGGDEVFAPLDESLDLEQIVALGQRIWKLVEANKPVVDIVEQPRVSAVPEGTESWMQLEGWQNPRSRVYRIEYKNLYGITVIAFAFRVTFTYGGGVKGKGQYLANVSVIPAEVQVAWGYKFNASVEVAKLVNAGSRQSPIAGMELGVRWQIDTVMKHERRTSAFFVRGDGEFVDLSASKTRL